MTAGLNEDVGDLDHRRNDGRKGEPELSPGEVHRLLDRAAAERNGGRGWLVPVAVLLLFGALVGLVAVQAASTFRALRGALQHRQEVAQRLEPEALLDPQAQLTPTPPPVPTPQEATPAPEEAAPTFRPMAEMATPQMAARPGLTAAPPASPAAPATSGSEVTRAAQPAGPIRAQVAAARRIALGLTVTAVLLLALGAWRLLTRR